MAACPGEGVTLGISGWGCAVGTLEPLAYTRASSAIPFTAADTYIAHIWQCSPRASCMIKLKLH